MTFRIGQKVVCVDDSNNFPHGTVMICQITGLLRTVHGGLSGLTKGEVYTVRDHSISWQTGQPAIFLEEIVRNVTCDLGEPPFLSSRFRPLIEKGTESGVAILKLVALEASIRFDHKKKRIQEILDK